ncbi:hypothetical protein D1007_20380 [Hordeum vulgare]|nr:hypothetical protein D1007_20380 [Hordeum vulgare]
MFTLEEADNCGFVQWVDLEWPPTLQNALLKLWEMYENNNSGRRKYNLESSLTINILTKEKNKIEGNYDRLVQDVHELFNVQEDRMMDFSYLNDRMKGVEVTNFVVSDMKMEMEKKDVEIFKLKHLQEKEEVSEASKNLQLKVDELNESQEKLTQENSNVKLTWVILRRDMRSSL